MRHLLFALMFSLCAACSVVTPPPLMMHQTDSTFRSQPGTVTAGAFAGVGGGVFLNGAVGGIGALDYQAADGVKLGVSGAVGGTPGGQTISAATTLGAGRVYAQVRPAGVDWLALNAGVGGGGLDSGMRYGTADVGVSGGWTFARHVRPYGAWAIAVAVPFVAGQPLDSQGVKTGADAASAPAVPSGRYARTTFYADATAGLAVAASANLEFALELHALFGQSLQSDGVGALSATTGLRYRFGKPAADVVPHAPLADDPTEDAL